MLILSVTFPALRTLQYFSYKIKEKELIFAYGFAVNFFPSICISLTPQLQTLDNTEVSSLKATKNPPLQTTKMHIEINGNHLIPSCDKIKIRHFLEKAHL